MIVANYCPPGDSEQITVTISTGANGSMTERQTTHFPVQKGSCVVADNSGTIQPPPLQSWNSGNPWSWLEIGAWAAAFIFIFGASMIILYKIYKGSIDLSKLVSEADGKGSLSRFQALMFTFVFITALSVIVIRTGGFPTEIPWSVLALLGGSLGTYLTSKLIQVNSGDAGAAVSGGSAAIGPFVRYGPGAAKLLSITDAAAAAAKMAQSSGAASFAAVAASGQSLPNVRVAVMVGGGKLQIAATGTDGSAVTGTVSYRNASSAEMSEPLSAQKTIDIDQASISEVFVSYDAATAARTVTTTVSTTS